MIIYYVFCTLATAFHKRIQWWLNKPGSNPNMHGCYWLNYWHVLVSKGTTLLIPYQDLFMVHIVYRFNKNNDRKGDIISKNSSYQQTISYQLDLDLNTFTALSQITLYVWRTESSSRNTKRPRFLPWGFDTTAISKCVRITCKTCLHLVWRRIQFHWTCSLKLIEVKEHKFKQSKSVCYIPWKTR